MKKLFFVVIISFVALGATKAALGQVATGVEPDGQNYSSTNVTQAPVDNDYTSGDSGYQATDSTANSYADSSASSGDYNGDSGSYADAGAQATTTENATINESADTYGGGQAKVVVKPQPTKANPQTKTVYVTVKGVTKRVYTGLSGASLQRAIRRSLISYVPENRLFNLLSKVQTRIDGLDQRLKKIEQAMPALQEYRQGKTKPQKIQWQAISTAQATANRALKTANSVTKPNDVITDIPGGNMYLFMAFVLIVIVLVMLVTSIILKDKNSNSSATTTVVATPAPIEEDDEITEHGQLNANRYYGLGTKDVGATKGGVVYGKGGKIISCWERWDNLPGSDPKSDPQPELPKTSKNSTSTKSAPKKGANPTTIAS